MMWLRQALYGLRLWWSSRPAAGEHAAAAGCWTGLAFTLGVFFLVAVVLWVVT